MTPAKIKLTIYQGATFRKSLGWAIRTGTGPGAILTPVDLTGCKARMQVRDEVGAPLILAELTTENGGIALEPLAGRIKLYMSAADTALIMWSGGVYDLEIVWPDTTVDRLFYGSVNVSPEVTR